MGDVIDDGLTPSLSLTSSLSGGRHEPRLPSGICSSSTFFFSPPRLIDLQLDLLTSSHSNTLWILQAIPKIPLPVLIMLSRI